MSEKPDENFEGYKEYLMRIAISDVIAEIGTQETLKLIAEQFYDIARMSQSMERIYAPKVH